MVSISPLGDSAMLISFGNVIDEKINNKVLRLFKQFKTLDWVKDVVPAYSSIAIYYDINAVKTGGFEYLKKEIQLLIAKDEETDVLAGRTIKVPVCYAEKFAPDIATISVNKNLSADQIIQLHISKKYRVYMIGFLPGFAYMGEVDGRIAVPRRDQPRTNIEAGSVGIAGKQTGIYPLTSPGGWQIIGRTPLKLFDKEKQEPVLFQPGDEVEFYSISENEYSDIKSRDL